MCAHQSRLPGTGAAAKPYSEIDDFAGLPRNIRPTTMRVIAVGVDVLYVHYYDHKQPVVPPHKRLFNTLVKFDTVDGPGGVTVMLVWGKGQVARDFQAIDRGGWSAVESVTSSEVKDRIRRWVADRVR